MKRACLPLGAILWLAMVACTGSPTAPAPITPLVVEAARLPIPTPTATPDYAALRAVIGPLAPEEISRLDPDLVARWSAFMAGDDDAYHEADAAVIEALRSKEVYRIGGAYLTYVDDYEGRSVGRVGYAAIDARSGQEIVIGWLDAITGDVIEARTGYRLNVRDHGGLAPEGAWIETGPAGEQLYCYGFSYYQRWGRILPDPIIELVKDFYSEGVAHIQAHLDEYRTVAESFGYDMRLIEWDENTARRATDWLPDEAAPPFVVLPDSGTVDIRRERFREALERGRVLVDGESLDAFLSSDYAVKGYFMQPDTSRADVVSALLKPYRSGWLFSDLEAAYILGATYAGDEPLVIRITPRLADGVMVPRGRKEMLVSSYELADVIMGYPGVLNSRWPHEMAHLVDFQAEQYTLRGRPPGGGSRCEPVKYLMEYMWWVQRYPGDAPTWDWMPTGSGLALARLLTGLYPNSGC